MVDVLHVRRAVGVVVLWVVAAHGRRGDSRGLVALVGGLLPTDAPMRRPPVPEPVVPHTRRYEVPAAPLFKLDTTSPLE